MEPPQHQVQYKVPHAGRPITVVVEIHGPDSASMIEAEMSSATDTDVEHMMDYPQFEPVLPEVSGVVKARICPTCGADIFSGLALIRHMCLHHPDIRPYKCEMCDSAFNNLKEMSSHKSVVHRVVRISCKSCDYKSTTHARMRQHVRIHSKGLKCLHCPKTFPSVASLRKHTSKHTHRE